MTKVVIVGASGDIGSSVHKKFKDDDVITFSKTQAPKFQSTHHYLDLSQPIERDDLASYFQHIDVIDTLIYTPGEALFELIQDTDLSTVDKQYNINIRSLVAFIQILLPKLRESEQASIIVMSSVWGTYGSSMESVYSAFKGAQETLVKSLAKEFAPSGISVNAIAPGVVRGRMTLKLSKEDIKYMLEDLPQGRLIEPEEVADLTLYLASSKARSITGEVLKINGGWFT
ncbi:SDR family oxidoreductase [Jeotgalicoccus huakuii]|uniref:SDR family NAD(P)-dependent oxidoreductase n=1 Tax=Jeotgalicoccus sp. ATCC 8456 TaxID=946435 RepID=UPI0018E637C3|nr:SDR family oxidoreductase [Jeotgalicoccus sp. ATCC 8456]MCK1975469.1 SDR family oxidoreductase [Jeotgalicoccus huakuii]QQD85703.1 SDR family oxidoreductase [Jeotgalicoccus sp. ATCC 8456]